jgi:hypothetical protein
MITSVSHSTREQSQYRPFAVYQKMSYFSKTYLVIRVTFVVFRVYKAVQSTRTADENPPANIFLGEREGCYTYQKFALLSSRISFKKV